MIVSNTRKGAVRLTQVYIANFSIFDDDSSISSVLPKLDSRRQKKICSLKTTKKKAQSIVAGLLLNKLFGEGSTYCYNDCGKPYLVDNQAYFNISHCDEWVALAVSDKEIGFDLQSISPIRPAVLRRCFTVQEQNWIGEDAERFTCLWVRKEAYAKYTGEGLVSPIVDIIPSESVPFCEGEWKNMRYALFGDNQLTINLLDAKDLL